MARHISKSTKFSVEHQDKLAKQKTKEQDLQHDKFIETARALGCDESEKDFAEKLKAIASVKPKPAKKGKKK